MTNLLLAAFLQAIVVQPVQSCSNLAGLAHSSFIRCPVDALKWSYRGPLVLQEILRSDADIVCLEEVDHFDDFLHPQLEENGFSGLYVEKRDSPCLEYTPNNGPDGCALFYRSSKLLLLKKREVVLNREDGTKSNQVAILVQLKLVGDLIMERSSHETVTESENNKDKNGSSNITVAQSSEMSAESKLEDPVSSSSRPHCSQIVCIAVTHLKAKREGRERRVAQGKHLLSELASFAENHPVIVCGDFNATADEPVYKYFSGSDSHDLPPLKLSSSYVMPHYGNKEPPLTSWKFRAAGEAKYTIDYIWFTPDSLKVDSIWTVPTEEEIGKDGLPCEKYPSDHVSICSCFRL